MTDRSARRRNVDVKALLAGVLSAVVFVGAIAVVIVNQQTVGWVNLAWMLGGLGALLVLLWLYNRRYR